MISNKIKIEVANDFLKAQNDTSVLFDIINLFNITERDKRMLLSRYSNKLENGELNPLKIVAIDIGISSEHYTSKLLTELLPIVYDELKCLFKTGKLK